MKNKCALKNIKVKWYYYLIANIEVLIFIFLFVTDYFGKLSLLFPEKDIKTFLFYYIFFFLFFILELIYLFLIVKGIDIKIISIPLSIIGYYKINIIDEHFISWGLKNFIIFSLVVAFLRLCEIIILYKRNNNEVCLNLLISSSSADVLAFFKVLL